MIIARSELTAIHNHGRLFDVNIKTYRSGISSLHLLEDNIQTIYMAIVFKGFSPFLETFNDRLHRMMSNGLIDYWQRNENNPEGFMKKVDKIGPQVLTMEHLEIAFWVCMIPLAFACIAFICEISYPACKQIVPTIVAYFVIRAFVNLKSVGMRI